MPYPSHPHLDSALWWLKQLVPHTYSTEYGDGEGRRHLVTWNMWLGHCFNVDDVVMPEVQ